ncbi:MAG: DUF3592 domain-containing protein [Pseudomonadota bacterium]
MSTRSGASRKHLLAGILVLDLAGACLLWTLRDHILPHNWQKASGVVVGTREESSPAPTGGICLVVDYSYVVDGASFMGERYRSSHPCLGPSRARLERYRPGSQIAVWYDRNEPSFAVMDPVYEWDSAWMWCLFLILIAMGNIELIGQARRAPHTAAET